VEKQALDTASWQAENDTMRTANDVFGWNKSRQSTPVQRVSRLVLLASGACFCVALTVWAQTPDSQAGDENKSWTATTESQADNANPTRTIESHTQSGNRTVDKQSLQVRGPEGNFQPFQDIEKESVQVNATTLRTTTRTFGRDGSGAKTLLQVREEESQTLPGGGSKVVRTTSNPDANGNLQLVQREIEDTKKLSPDVEETKTTVMMPSINGGLAPTMQVEQRQKRSGGTVEVQKTTLLPDGAGSWQVSEVRQGTVKEEGKNRSSEERVSRPGADGKLTEVSRTVGKETEGATGEKRNTVETYSGDVPGSARDGSLHLVQRVTTAERTDSSGQKTTEQVEQPNPGDPGAGLRVTTLTTDTVRAGASGEQATRTIQVLGASGSLGIVSVDTTKSDKVHAVQVQIAPSDKPK
jgi:hypothetical protein